MPDFSNRDLDKLFQQGAERYDFEFKPEAWEQMEALLQRDRRRRLLWWWLGGILLALLLLFALWQGVLSQKEAPDSPPPAQVEQLRPANPSPADPAMKKPVPQTPASTPQAAKDIRSDTSPKKAGKPPSGPPPPPGGETALVDRPETKHGMTGEKTAVDQEEPATAFELQDPDTSGQQIRIGGSPIRNSVLEQTMAPLLAQVTEEVKRRELPELPERKAPVENIEPVNNRKGGFYIGFNLSEESASVGADDFGNFGTKAGVNLEYRFPRHFSVGAAVYYTRKDYSAGPGEYTPSYGFWTRGIAPEQTVGYCTMVEIPVYAGYYFQSTRKNSFYLEGGLINFIMLEEHYRFFYENPAPDLIRYWGSEDAYHTWMGILQFSPGYQFRLGGRFAIQGGPFIQIPIAGVGHGDLNLYSLGLNLRFALRPFGQ